MKQYALTFLALTAAVASDARSETVTAPAGMPEALAGVPPRARELSREFGEFAEKQMALAQKVRQAGTLEERLKAIQALKANVRAIAQKRVAIVEEFAAQARARVEWARKHASEVRVEELVRSTKQLAHRGSPLPPPPGERPPPQPRAGLGMPPELIALPEEVRSARGKLEQARNRLQEMGAEIRQARTEEERERLRNEIKQHLKTIEKTRVALLEAVLEISEKRLQWAKNRAQETGGPRRAE